MNILEPQIWLSLLTLTFLEIILGIDNLVFISIVSHDVRLSSQKTTRRLGLLGALVTRLILLASIFWIIHINTPLFSLFGQSFSLRDLILLAGGLFLLVKGTTEIHHTIETDGELKDTRKLKSMGTAIAQIMLVDLVFSLDSIMTAVGLTELYWIMATAIIIAVLLMLFASEPMHKFIHSHPTIKILTLSFLLLIGVVLIADGFQFHIPREYIYFAVAFSILVEFLNSLVRRKKKNY